MPVCESRCRRILVVDDERDVADSLAIMLTLEGHEVKVAYDGESALALVGDFIPQVILVDLGMPRMDGCALARKLRQREELALAQLVAVSGYAQPCDRERSRAAGIHYHLAKPVDPLALLTFIEQLGDTAQDRRALAAKREAMDTSLKLMPNEALAGELDDPQLVASILSLVRDRTGIDFSRYRPAMVRRRIVNRMISLGVSSLEHYHELLHASEAEPYALLERVAINVSGFYRNPGTFDFLRSRIMPSLAKACAGRALRIWSIGCARGEEPYTLAMLLDEARIEGIVEASDIEPGTLAAAQAGIYGDERLAQLPADLFARYCEPLVGDGCARYRIRPAVRERVRFSQHDILSQAAPPGGEPFDLISCRNVLIYLQVSLQGAVFRTIVEHLRPGAYLCLGEAEWPCRSAERELTTIDSEARVFALSGEKRDP